MGAGFFVIMEPIYLSKGKRFLERASQAVYDNLDSLSFAKRDALENVFTDRASQFGGSVSASNVILNYRGLAKVLAISFKVLCFS